MWANLLGSAIVSGSVVAVLVKWLLDRHDKREEKLEETRRANVQLEIERLSNSAVTLAQEVKKLTAQFVHLDKTIAVMSERSQHTTAESDKLFKAFQGYVASNQKRFEAVETKVREIANLVYRVQTTKKGGQNG